jgi:HlyD family secretion protein
MAEERRQIFRQTSLEQLESPDRTDQLLRVIGPQAWIALFACGCILALAVLWSVVGRVPETVDGVAFLVRPQQIVGFQAPASGRLMDIAVEVGDRVRAGDLLATLELPDLDKQLELERIRLDEARDLAAQMRKLEEELVERDQRTLEEQKKILTARIETLQRDALEVKSDTEESLARQEDNLKTATAVSQDLQVTLDELGGMLDQLSGKMEDLEKSVTLLETIDARLRAADARARASEVRLRIDEINAEQEQIELQKTVARESFDRKLDTIEDVKLALKQIDVELVALDRRLKARELEDRSRIQEIERNVEFLDARLKREREVRSEYDGRILEVTAFRGDRVDLGTRLGKIAIEDADIELMAVAYFRVADGKKISAGEKAGAMAEALVTPSTVQRARHGGIRGRVQSVSDFPVTTAAAAHQIGDEEIARALLGGETRIEVLVSLERNPDAPSGLAWSSGKGPEDVVITAGTTAQVRVKIGERAPITYVLPFLKGLAGLETVSTL